MHRLPTFSYNIFHQGMRFFSWLAHKRFQGNWLKMNVWRKLTIFTQTNRKPSRYGTICIYNLSALVYFRNLLSQTTISVGERYKKFRSWWWPPFVLPLMWRNVSHWINGNRLWAERLQRGIIAKGIQQKRTP